MYETPLEFIDSFYYWFFGLIIADFDIVLMKLFSWFKHRNIMTHSIIPAIPAFLLHNMAAGMLCFTLGLHLLFDISKSLGKEYKGTFQELHILKWNIGKAQSVIWLLGNGVILIVCGIGFMLI